MAKLEADYHERILGVYGRAMGVICLAERILEREYQRVTAPSIKRCWKEHELEIVKMSDLVKEKIRSHARQSKNDPEAIARCLRQDFKEIIPDYSMTPTNVVVQMRSIGLRPYLKPRGKYERKYNSILNPRKQKVSKEERLRRSWCISPDEIG